MPKGVGIGVVGVRHGVESIQVDGVENVYRGGVFESFF